MLVVIAMTVDFDMKSSCLLTTIYQPNFRTVYIEEVDVRMIHYALHATNQGTTITVLISDDTNIMAMALPF